jgi:hypothetical protein
MLWIALFYCANKRAQYSDESHTYEWPDDFFPVSNSELNSYGQFDKRAIETLRNSLKQRGLIDFIKGEKNKRNPAYKINYLTRVGYKYAPNSVPNNAPNNVPNSVPNNAPNSGFLGTKKPPTMPPYNKYNNININNSYSDSVKDYTAREGARTGGLVDLEEDLSGTEGLVPLQNMEGW